jgi:hypothetical protein
MKLLINNPVTVSMIAPSPIRIAPIKNVAQLIIVVVSIEIFIMLKVQEFLLQMHRQF